jgi:hypothetical protein
MSLVYTELTLKNFMDIHDCKRGRIKESEIREMTVRRRKEPINRRILRLFCRKILQVRQAPR